MGYTTEFEGQLDLTPALNADQIKYLKRFARTRRMKRHSSIAETMQDTKREAVTLPIGIDGEYFVGGLGEGGQNCDHSIIEYNKPPHTQPSLWCQWIPSESGDYIEWDGGEKFYHYIEWLRYIIENFLKPWGIEANGVVHWRGEEFEDNGTITVSSNFVNVKGQLVK